MKKSQELTTRERVAKMTAEKDWLAGTPGPDSDWWETRSQALRNDYLAYADRVIAIVEGDKEARQQKRELEDEAWGDVWLHGKWRYLTKQMTTPAKELVADAVERWNARLNAEDDSIEGMDQEYLRWWRY